MSTGSYPPCPLAYLGPGSGMLALCPGFQLVAVDPAQKGGASGSPSTFNCACIAPDLLAGQDPVPRCTHPEADRISEVAEQLAASYQAATFEVRGTAVDRIPLQATDFDDVKEPFITARAYIDLLQHSRVLSPTLSAALDAMSQLMLTVVDAVDDVGRIASGSQLDSLHT
jgi:hypothetical protein